MSQSFRALSLLFFGEGASQRKVRAQKKKAEGKKRFFTVFDCVQKRQRLKGAAQMPNDICLRREGKPVVFRADIPLGSVFLFPSVAAAGVFSTWFLEVSMERDYSKLGDQKWEPSKCSVGPDKHLVCEKGWMGGSPQNLINKVMACCLNTCLPLLLIQVSTGHVLASAYDWFNWKYVSFYGLLPRIVIAMKI